MARRSTGFKSGGTIMVHAAPRFGLAALGAVPNTHCLTVPPLYVTVVGRPYWTVPELQAVAQQAGPAQAVADAFRRAGADALRDMRGSFSLLLIDLEQDLVLLAVDRMGTLPLCYAENRHGLAFGDTTTSVQTHPSFRSSVALQAVYDYLFFHVIPSPRTIYSGTSKLEPGQYLRYQAGRASVGFYWNPSFSENGPPSIDALGEELRSLLRRAVDRLRPDQRTGAFLSGGLDSSTVAGLLAQSAGGPARTFSIGFDAPGYDEMEYARITARHFATAQHEYYVTPADVEGSIREIARAYDEPFGNSSAVPTYYCARLAKQHGVSNMLAGDGGDELFGGNARYAKQKIFGLYSAVPRLLRERVLEPALLATPATASVPLLRKVRSYIEQARIPMPDRTETYNFLLRTPLAEILHPDFAAAIDPDEPLRALRQTYERSRARTLVNRMLFLDWKFTLADNDLRKVNRMCELAGVTVHYPMLDDELVEFSTRVPAHLKVKGRQLRYFYKHALASFLPAKTIAKSKHGFGLPFGMWMREHEPLQRLAYDSLARLARRNYLRSDYLARLTELHRQEHASYYGEFIWVLMMLELWLSSHDA